MAFIDISPSDLLELIEGFINADLAIDMANFEQAAERFIEWLTQSPPERMRNR